MNRGMSGWIYLSATLFIRALFLGGVIVTAMQGNWETAIVSAIGLLLSFLPQVIKRTLHVDLPLVYEFIIVLFVMLSMLMGEVGHAYAAFWWWDVMLHASSGVLLGYVGFLVLYILYQQKMLKTSAIVIAFFTFAVGMASAGVWEIIEFTVDQIFGTHMQRGADDTMNDMVVAGLGSLLAATAAYAHIKWPSKGLYYRWVQKFFDVNPKFNGIQAKRTRRA